MGFTNNRRKCHRVILLSRIVNNRWPVVICSKPIGAALLLNKTLVRYICRPGNAISLLARLRDFGRPRLARHTMPLLIANSPSRKYISVRRGPLPICPLCSKNPTKRYLNFITCNVMYVHLSCVSANVCLTWTGCAGVGRVDTPTGQRMNSGVSPANHVWPCNEVTRPTI